LVLLLPSNLNGEDCAGQALSQQQKLSRFKQLDQDAESAMQQHQPRRAIQSYQQAVCLVPNSARGFFGLGVAEAAAGDFVSARESLRTADRLQPTTAAPLVMQVRVSLSLGDLDTLKADLRELASRFPHDAAAHQELARSLAAKNLFVLAVAEALRSQQASSGDISSAVQLAVLENSVGAYEDAIRNAVPAYQNSQLASEFRAAAAGIAGLSYESLANSERAIYYLRQAIQLDPSQENSYLALADLFDQSQKYADSVNILQQARLNIPNSLPVLLSLGINLIHADDYPEGTQILHQLIREAPNTPEAYIGLADAARQTNNSDRELTALDGLQRYQPGYPMLHVLKARAMLAAEHPDYSKALAELAQAEIQSPDDPDVFYLRGKILFTTGHYNESAAALRHAIELRATDASPYYQLAKVYQKLGEADKARELFERVRFLEASDSH
jgi:tetratricopeptide (TPR) repeat protein